MGDMENEKADVTIKITTDNNDEKKDDWESKEEWDLIEELFTNQIAGYFRIPFDNIKPQQEVRVDLYYTESLQILNNAFYLKIPMKFDKSTLKNGTKWNGVINQIKATVYHPENANTTIVSRTHK